MADLTRGKVDRAVNAFEWEENLWVELPGDGSEFWIRREPSPDFTETYCFPDKAAAMRYIKERCFLAALEAIEE